MSTLKTDAITAVSTDGDLSLDGIGTGGVSIASTLKMTKGGDIASASPLVIDTDGNYFDVTGTTSFAAMTVEAGNYFMLQFDGVLTITHGSGIELPGATNLTTAAGDRLICYATAANTVEVMSVETEAAASSGIWNLIETSVASSSASITLNPISTTYDTYVIIGADLVPATDDVEAWFRIGDSSGIDSAGGDYHWFVQGRNLDSSTDHLFATHETDTKIALCETGGELTGNQAGEGFGFVLWLHNPSDSTMRPSVSFVSTFSNQGAVYGGWHGGGQRRAVLTITQVQFLFESGNIATGRCSLYGIAHA